MSDIDYRTEPSMDSYDFTPSLDSEGIIDYTGVHPDKIYLASRKTILSEELPSFLPPVEIRRDRQYDIPSFKESENSYLLRGSDTMYRDEAGNFQNPRIYRVSLDVYAALIHYHLEYDRAAFQAIAKQNEEFRMKALEEGVKEYKTIKENEVPLIPQKLDVSSLHANQRNWNTSVENKASRVSLWSTKSNRMNVEPYYFMQDMSKAQGAQYPRNAIFKLHRECLEDVNQKILDMEAQKADWESSWTKGRETSYGEIGLNDSLYTEYGVMVKRQNGESITREEIEDIRGSIQQVHSVFGNISEASRKYGLKLSHAGDTNMHASKYVGLFTPYYKAIGVSFKGGSIEAGLTAVHEYAHFLDHLSGKELNAWHASDVPGTFENQIAVEFRSQMNEIKGAYWNRTCECFARAIEEHAHISILREQDGIDGFSFSSSEAVNKEVSKPAYVNYLAFQEHVEPLIANLLEHYRERFAVETEEAAERIDSSLQKEGAVKSVQKRSILIPDGLTNDELQRRIYNLALEKSKLDKEARRVSELISAEKRDLFDGEALRLATELKDIDHQTLILSNIQENSQLIEELEVSKAALYEQYKSLSKTFVPESEKLTQFIENEAGIEQRLLEIESEGRALTFALMDREENEKIAKKNEIERKIGVGNFTQLELFEPGHTYVEDDTAHYYNGDLFTEGDPALTRDHIREAKAAARTYSLPVLNGEKTGLWTKFRDFEKHGVFDILGVKVATGRDGNITMAGWEQLHQAMQIYRDKRFETFRVLFISPEGEIKDQVIVSSRLPDRVFVGPLFGLGVEQIINQAVESNTRIIVAHNHPSGNIEPSEADKSLTERLKNELVDKEGNSLFVGHIILDHDMFGLYRADDWYTILGKAQEHDPLLKNELPDFTETRIVGPNTLKTVAESINETEKWNTKDWVPVLFTDGYSRVSSISCYSRDWFVNTPSKAIVEEFRVVGVAAGANNAYPVLSGENAQDSRLVDAVFEHYGNGCFKDFYLEGINLTEYRTIDFGRGIFDGISTDEIIERTTVESTSGIERSFMTLDEYLEKVSSEETVYSPDGSTPFRVITDPGLYGEIDGVSRADIGKVNSFIKITDKTPYILKLNGLPDKQITMYRDKIARALFLEPAMPGHRSTHGHSDSLDKEVFKRVLDSLADPQFIFSSKDGHSLVGVYDIVDRTGEPIIIAFSYNIDRNGVEANWVKSVYGKDGAGIERWANEGLLRYINDKEKETELPITLYMRVIGSSAAYSKNILHKSEIVNEIPKKHLEARSQAQRYEVYESDEIERNDREVSRAGRSSESERSRYEVSPLKEESAMNYSQGNNNGNPWDVDMYEKKVIGTISYYAASNVPPEVVNYFSQEEFLKDLSEAFEVRPNSIKYEVLDNSPDLRKGVDSLVSNYFGLSDEPDNRLPNHIEDFYFKMDINPYEELFPNGKSLNTLTEPLPFLDSNNERKVYEEQYAIILYDNFIDNTMHPEGADKSLIKGIDQFLASKDFNENAMSYVRRCVSYREDFLMSQGDLMNEEPKKTEEFLINNNTAAAKEVNDPVKGFYDALGLDFSNSKPDSRVNYFEDFYKSIAVDPYEPLLAEGKSLYSTNLLFENTEKYAEEGRYYESDAATILALGYFDEAGSTKPKGIDEFLASSNFDLDKPEVAEALARVKYERSIFLEQRAENDKTQEETLIEPKKPYSQVNTESFLDSIKNDTAPFLVNTSNAEADTVSILPTAIRSAESGRIFRGMNQILAQTSLAEMGGKDTEIITYEQAKRHGAGIKKGSQGINLTTFDMGTHTQKVWRYYPRSAVYNRDKLPAIPEQEKSSLVVKCVETTPERYLAKYLAATSLGARFETTKDVMSEFKRNIFEDVQDHYHNGKYTRIYELGNKASVICQNTINDIAKEKEAEKKRAEETKKEKVIRVARTVPYNPVTGEKFIGVNEQKAEFVMQQRQSKDPRFLEITDILKAGLSLKKDVSERLVISVNGKSRFFYNAADVEGIPPRSAAITRDTGIKDRKVQRAQEMDMGL